MLDPTAGGNGMTGPSVEPRSGGLQQIQVDFRAPLTLTANPVPGIIVSDGPNNYSATSASQVDSDTIAIQFNAGVLPDQKCYTITIGPGTVTQTLGGDPDCKIRALSGDTTGDGIVNLSDMLFTRTKGAGSVTAASAPQNDVNLSGDMIDLSDALFIKSLVTSPANQALCP